MPDFPAGLDGHIAHGQPVVDGHRPHGLSSELHGAVKRSAHADPPDGRQDEILPANPRARLTHVLEPYRLRNLQPDLAERHRASQVSAADPRRERSQAAVRHRMGVSADDHIAWPNQPGLRQHHVFDAVPSIVEVRDVLLLRESPHLAADLGRVHVLVRREVVQQDEDPLRVKHALRTHALEHVHCDGAGDVVGHQPIRPNLHYLPPDAHSPSRHASPVSSLLWSSPSVIT